MDQNGLVKGLKWNSLFQSFFRIFVKQLCFTHEVNAEIQ